MTSLNRCIFVGRLTKNVELRYTQSGVPVASFTLAVDRAFKDSQGNRETDFINIVVWRQQAENCANYLAKGKLAAVDGSLQIRSYTDKDGNKRISPEVVADTVRFLSPKDGQTHNHATQGDLPFDEPEEMLGDSDLPF